MLPLFVLPLSSLAGFSCSQDAVGGSLGQSAGPPASVLAEGAPPPVVKPSLCADDACCAEELGIVDNPCAQAVSRQGHCAVVFEADGARCGGVEGDLCSPSAACSDGECVAEEWTDPCAAVGMALCGTPTCNPKTGACDLAPLPDGTNCGGDDICSGTDECLGGVCLNTIPPVACDDNNPCTLDECATPIGCVHKPEAGAPCDDGDLCTAADHCDPIGACQGTGICGCETDNDCIGKGDACEGPVSCVEGLCAQSDGPVTVCDDDNPCTQDQCDPATGSCHFEPTGGDCDDGDPCTAQDVCDGGECMGTAKDCGDADPCTSEEHCAPDSGECVSETVCDPCESAADCPPLGLCAGQYACVAGACEIMPGSAVDCSAMDSTPCYSAVCDDVDGQCKPVPMPAGTPCEDGNACTSGELCDAAGTCGGGTAVSCAAGGDCMEVSCQPDSGCVSAPVSGQSCDDGDACTTDDVCKDGGCQGQAPASCDDQNPCTVDTCDPLSGCVNTVSDGAICDDGDTCTGPDLCDANGECASGDNTCGCVSDADCPDDDDLCNGVPVCVAGVCQADPATVVICAGMTGPNGCQKTACAPSTGMCALSPMPNGTGCDDGDACTSGDVCVAGLCGGTTLVCSDGNACTADSCDKELGCTTTPLNVACDDGDPCTADDTCAGGECVGGTQETCDDKNGCTSDFCVAGFGCKHSFAIGTCNDGDACTHGDACKSGLCVGDPVVCLGGSQCVPSTCDPSDGQCHDLPMDCNDDNACTSDNCVEGSGCEHPAVNCTDNDPCTVDSCDPATGCASTPTDCGDSDACTVDSCDPSTGDCAHADKDCNDNDPCTDDSCWVDGGCLHIAIACDDGDPCSVDQCVAGACTYVDKTCDDANACTDDACDGATGACAHKLVDCADGDACTDNSCDGSAGCVVATTNCDDGLTCTTDTCDMVTGCAHVADDVACEDGNDCTQDLCDVNLGCQNPPGDDGDVCSDGDPCTADDTCSAGVCEPGIPSCGPCAGLPHGAACDDGDADTVGDVCIDWLCAGFSAYMGKPTGSGSSPALGAVTWTGGAFWAIGSDAGVSGGGSIGKGRAWIAKIDGPSVVIDSGSILPGSRYRALTERAAVTSNGEIAIQQGAGWTTDNALGSMVAASPGGGLGAAAIWGGTHGGKDLYFVSGRQAGQSWILRCAPGQPGSSACEVESASFIQFAVLDLPRAMTGWGLGGPDGGVILLTDYSADGQNEPFFNDAFERLGLGPGKAFSLSQFESTGGTQQSTDVDGPGYGEFWSVGLDGLIRRHAPGDGSNDWKKVAGVLPQQSKWALRGVSATQQVVLVAGDRAGIAGSRRLSLFSHDPASADSQGWTELQLIKTGPAVCLGGVFGAGDCPKTGGALVDVWNHQGTVVVTGWVWDNLAAEKKALHLVRVP